MGNKTRRVLPPEVRKELEVFEDALARASAGAAVGDVVKDVDLAAERAFRAALRAGEGKGPSRVNINRSVDFGAMVADKVRRLYEGSGWTQAQLAECMSSMGFSWKRVTVAEVVGNARKVTMEELLGLASAFGVPMFALLLPEEGDYVKFPDQRSLSPDTVSALMLGTGGMLGEGGANWPAASEVAGVAAGKRPAKDLSERRSRGYGKVRGND